MSLAQKLARLADIFVGNQSAYGIPFSNRNYMIDGRFDNWTAASGVATGGFSVATMYRVSSGAGGAATFGQTTSYGFGGVVLDSAPKWCFLHQQTTASTGTVAARTAPFIVQKVESSNTLQGRSATLSVKLWVTSGSITIPGIALSQDFGSGGSPSPLLVLDKTVNWVVTTTPQRFSVRLDVPTVAGKTPGTNGDDSLSVGLWLPPGVTFSLVGAEMQLEQSSPNSSSDINGNGGDPTAFEYRGQQAELARVQRYYVAPGFGSIQCGYADVATRAIAPLAYWFPVVMRAAPTGVVSTSGGVNASVGAVSTNPYGAVLGCSGIAAGYVQYSYTLTSFDARL
jgi:hypothetical protein